MAQIEFLPTGWEWVPANKETYSYTNSRGEVVYSNARHAKNSITGETLPLRQVQNIQRVKRDELGKPKGPTVRRKGLSRTIKGHYDKKSTLYNPEVYGRIETKVFYTFDDAMAWAAMTGFPEWVTTIIIHIRYTERLVTTNRPGSDALDKNGYASLTGFERADESQGDMVFARSRGIIPMPWEGASRRILNYDMSGDRARVYIVMIENQVG